MVYDELKAMAARYMRREREGHTLQATALVNEAYLKLVNMKSANRQDRNWCVSTKRWDILARKISGRHR